MSYASNPGAREHRGHFRLAVDALLAQHRDRGSLAASDERRRDIFGRIVVQARMQPRIITIRELRIFLPSAVGIVA